MSTQRHSWSSSSSTPTWKYDVFLSFRGKDTRNGFVSHLYAALKQKGILTFKDDVRLEKGKPISSDLWEAIKESRFAIVIFSRNYASSTWCLNELLKIVECKKGTRMIVLPVFYKVDPSDIRNQRNTFAKAFDEHEIRFKKNLNKVQMWKDALKEVADTTGWHLQNRPEMELIQDIVKMILHKLNYTFLIDTKGLIGIDSQVENLMSHLAIGLDDVRMIGIRGMGGMGKTTLARVVYGMVSNKFDACSFIANIREVSKEFGLLRLQQALLYELLMERYVNIQDMDIGVSIIKNRLRHKRILLVLDDVSDLDQLKKLAGKHDWFGRGSRVIITTRDEHLLLTHKVNNICEPTELNYDEALHLFSLNAFGEDHPATDYLTLSQYFVQYTNGLPLAIEVLGSFLFNRSIEEWKSALGRLKEFPERKILDVLQISYDGLHQTEKEIFLHIACFFNHEDKDLVVEILDCLDFYPTIGLRVLVDKSLVKLHGNKLWMHNLLQEMGRDIVRQECRKEPWKRSRMWLYKDIDNVLAKNTEIEAVEGMVLKWPEPKEAHWNSEDIALKLPKPKEAHWNSEVFSKMRNLKLLVIHNVYFLHDPKHLSNGLKFLDWSGYRSKYLPSDLLPNELVGLRMCCNNIEQFLIGTKCFDKLKFIQLNESQNLTGTPDFTGFPNLEKLVMEDCLNLREVHPSIGVHKKLAVVNFKGCKSIKRLPNILEMESLKTLNLSGCSRVKRFPQFKKNVECLSELHLDGTAITKVANSIVNLTSLGVFSIKDCKSLMSLPVSLFGMESIKDFNVSGCPKLLADPVSEDFGRSKPLSYNLMLRNPDPLDLLLTSLFELNISHCNLSGIPNDICCLFSLKYLNLSGNHFGCLPESISKLSILRYLIVNNCTSLRSLPKLPLSIHFISGIGCTSLETVVELFGPNSLCEPELYFSDCGKLVDKHLQGRSLPPYCIIIPGSEIPEWFSHQSVGAEVNIRGPYSHLCNEWMGIAICAVFCPHPLHQVHESSLSCRLIANGKKMSFAPSTGTIVVSSDHIWLDILAPVFYMEEEIKSLWECDENGFSQIGIEIDPCNFKVKKCGFRLVYKKNIEDLNRFVAQRGKSSITPYKGFDVLQHKFSNSVVVAEGSKAKRSRDDYNGIGTSREGSCNDIPHPKRIGRLIEFMTHGNSKCEESSEYMECGESEVIGWDESSESGLES